MTDDECVFVMSHAMVLVVNIGGVVAVVDCMHYCVSACCCRSCVRGGYVWLAI